MIKTLSAIALSCALSSFGVVRCLGQTIINVPPGPSPTSAGANTVVNILPTGTLANNFQVLNGGILNIQGGNANQLTSFVGGITNIESGVVYSAMAEDGGVVNATGGEIRYFYADDNGTLNISGGNLIDRLDTTGAFVNISGGAFTDNFRARVNSQLTLYATDFRFNGNLVAGLVNPGDSVTIPITPIAHDYLTRSDYLSGVFENGLPFVLGGEYEPFAESVKLVLTAPYTPSPILFQVPAVAAPQGIHSGQTLILEEGGSLPDNFTAGHGSSLQVTGGTVGRNLEAIGADVEFTGGQFNTLDAFAGTIVNIGGSTAWSGMNVYGDAVVNINGGIYNGGNFLQALPGSTVNILDGELRGNLHGDTATVNVSGGEHESMMFEHFSNIEFDDAVVEEDIRLLSGSSLTVHGGTIRDIALSIGDSVLEGLATTRARIENGTIETLTSHDQDCETDILGGTVDRLNNLGGNTNVYGGAMGDVINAADGSLTFHGYDFQVNGVPISGLGNVGDSRVFNYALGTVVTGTLADGTPFNINSDESIYPTEINDGKLRFARSAVPVLPAAVFVSTDEAPHGVSSGQELTLADGGSLGRNFIAGQGSTVVITGGIVGDNFEADRSQVTVSGGTVGDHWDVFKGATVTVNGGSMGNQFEVFPGATLNIDGGTVGSQGRGNGGIINLSAGHLGSSFEALQGTTVNVAGGSVDRGFSARAGSVVSVTGGTVDINFEIYDGAVANISGGTLRELDVKSNGTANVSGGNIDDVNTTTSAKADFTGGSYGDGFTIHSASIASLKGTHFEVDGVPIAGLESPGNEVVFTMAQNSLFTGLLADGTPFAFRSSENDSINNLKLIRSADLPAPTPEIQIPSDSAPGGVRAGQTLTLQSSGQLPKNFTAGEGSTVNIEAGSVGDNFEAERATVNIQGGVVGNDFDAFAGSEINVSGGSVGSNMDANSGSTVNLTGGSISHLDALTGSAVNLSGGHLGRLQANAGSHTVWNGGTTESITANSSSSLGIQGVDFRVDGVPISGLNNSGDSLPFNIPANSILTGTLADGTPLVLGPYFQGQSSIAAGTLTLFQSEQPGPLSPDTYLVTSSIAPRALGQGQSLLMKSGGQLPDSFIAGKGSEVLVEGGSILPNFKAFESEISIQGGVIGSGFTALMGTTLDISGGQFGTGFQLFAGSQTEISGGIFPQQVSINSGAVVDIYGTSFLIGGVPISQLMNVGDSFQINQFNGQFLTAILKDGSQISWRLSQTTSGPRVPISGISSGALVTLHFVPEPISVVPFTLAGIGFISRRSAALAFRLAANGMQTQ